MMNYPALEIVLTSMTAKKKDLHTAGMCIIFLFVECRIASPQIIDDGRSGI